MEYICGIGETMTQEEMDEAKAAEEELENTVTREEDADNKEEEENHEG